MYWNWKWRVLMDSMSHNMNFMPFHSPNKLSHIGITASWHNFGVKTSHPGGGKKQIWFDLFGPFFCCLDYDYGSQYKIYLDKFYVLYHIVPPYTIAIMSATNLESQPRKGFPLSWSKLWLLSTIWICVLYTVYIRWILLFFPYISEKVC